MSKAPDEQREDPMAIRFASDFGGTLTGTSSADLLWGGDGKDLIYGRAGADNVYGGYGNDTLLGRIIREGLVRLA